VKKKRMKIVMVGWLWGIKYPGLKYMSSIEH